MLFHFLPLQLEDVNPYFPFVAGCTISSSAITQINLLVLACKNLKHCEAQSLRSQYVMEEWWDFLMEYKSS